MALIALPNASTTTIDNVEYGGAMQFQLLNVINQGELTVLYDQYRLDFIALQIWASVNGNTNGDPNALMPLMYYTPDYDDNTIPPDYITVAQYGACKAKRFDTSKPLRIKLKPRTAVMLYNTGVSTGYGQGNPKQFLDCNNNNIKHYGLKFWVKDHSTLNNPEVTFRVQPTYYLTMKSTR